MCRDVVWRLVWHSQTQIVCYWASVSGLKGGVVPSSSDVSGPAVKHERDGGRRKEKEMQEKWSKM